MWGGYDCGGWSFVIPPTSLQVPAGRHAHVSANSCDRVEPDGLRVLIALWVRSFWWRDSVTREGSQYSNDGSIRTFNKRLARLTYALTTMG